jgi:hypothetical protein
LLHVLPGAGLPELVSGSGLVGRGTLLTMKLFVVSKGKPARSPDAEINSAGHALLTSNEVFYISHDYHLTVYLSQIPHAIR